MQRAAAGALRNVVYQNDENKMEVKEKDGLATVLAALKSSRDVETRRELTGPSAGFSIWRRIWGVKGISFLRYVLTLFSRASVEPLIARPVEGEPHQTGFTRPHQVGPCAQLGPLGGREPEGRTPR